MHPSLTATAPGILDYVKAHAKLILAALTAILPQIVDGQTADTIIVVVGILLTGAVPNSKESLRLVYPKRYHEFNLPR